MRIVLDAEAEADLANQLDYLIAHHAAPAARALESRLMSFIEVTLANHPRAGTFVTHRDLWECWVPGTRIVVWYRFTDFELQIVRIWHTSQDRQR
jgi:plasmid stabilization system protein ParE